MNPNSSSTHMLLLLLQGCVSIRFKEVAVKNPYLVKQSTRTNKCKYYCFHKSHDHITNDCIHLNDAIEKLINKG